MEVRWGVDDARVVEIDGSGTVTGKLPGEATITARMVYRNSTSSFGASAASAASPPEHAQARANVNKGSTRIEPVGSTSRLGVAGELVVDAPAVRVVDKRGKGLSNVPMHFAASAGQLSTNEVYTDADGIATAVWRLGPTAGVQQLSAFAPDLSADTVTFAAQVSGAPAAVQATGGTSQSGVVGKALTQPLTVLVRDASGNPVAGAACRCRSSRLFSSMMNTAARRSCVTRRRAIAGCVGSSAFITSKRASVRPLH
jgi:hypothetical protein